MFSQRAIALERDVSVMGLRAFGPNAQSMQGNSNPKWASKLPECVIDGNDR